MLLSELHLRQPNSLLPLHGQQHALPAVDLAQEQHNLTQDLLVHRKNPNRRESSTSDPLGMESTAHWKFAFG